MKRPQTESLSLQGPAGALEALVESPDEPIGVAVICHPHPLYLGAMTNKIVHTVARAFNDAGYAALRFNFRGVGASGGKFDDAAGETDDALAVTSWARERWPGKPLWLAGFSFGAFVALRAAVRELPAGLVSIAIPVKRLKDEALAQPSCPWIVVQGDQDELVDTDEVVAWVDGLEPGPELVIMTGVDHFFHGRLRELRQRLYELLQPHIS